MGPVVHGAWLRRDWCSQATDLIRLKGEERGSTSALSHTPNHYIGSWRRLERESLNSTMQSKTLSRMRRRSTILYGLMRLPNKSFACCVPSLQQLWVAEVFFTGPALFGETAQSARPELFNVAMTRTQEALIVFGNAEVLSCMRDIC